MHFFAMTLIQEATVGCSATPSLRCPLRRASGAFGGAGNPRMRASQNPVLAVTKVLKLIYPVCIQKSLRM